MYEIKNEDVYEDFSNDKETFNFGSYASKSRFDDNSNKWVVDKMEDEKAKDTFVFCRW